jgi:hypothetical protein
MSASHMHARRFACMLLGMWLGCSALMTWITADSFNSAPRMLGARPSESNIHMHSLGREEARMMLAYPVRQQVAWWMEGWSDLEILLACCFFLFLLLGTREDKVALGLTLLPLAAAVFQRAATLPQLTYLGALVDFMPPNAAAPERKQLSAVRLALIGVEVFKLLAGAALAYYFIGRGPHQSGSHRRSGFSREEVDAIDKSHNRHVDG